MKTMPGEQEAIAAMLNSEEQSNRSQVKRDWDNTSLFIVFKSFAMFGVLVLTIYVSFWAPEKLGGGDQLQVSVKETPHLTEEQMERRRPAFLRATPKGLAEVIPEAVAWSTGVIVPQGIESHLPPISPNLTAKDASWQIVSGTRDKFFVFSAFYDRREDRCVRVIAFMETRDPERVWCRLWYNGSTSNGSASGASHSITMLAKVQVIQENFQFKYGPCFILCPLGKNLSSPSSVSVVRQLMMAPANHILVRNTDQDPDLKDMSGGIPERLAICVRPLHYNYNQALRMLEFLELNAILGVHHFIIYNETSGSTVGCILQDYMSRGVVTLIPWTIKMMLFRSEDRLASLNDCIYRTMYRYSHVALIDLDEFIVPRHNDTLPQLIKTENATATGVQTRVSC